MWNRSHPNGHFLCPYKAIDHFTRREIQKKLGSSLRHLQVPGPAKDQIQTSLLHQKNPLRRFNCSFRYSSNLPTYSTSPDKLVDDTLHRIQTLQITGSQQNRNHERIPYELNLLLINCDDRLLDNQRRQVQRSLVYNRSHLSDTLH